MTPWGQMLLCSESFWTLACKLWETWGPTTCDQCLKLEGGRLVGLSPSPGESALIPVSINIKLNCRTPVVGIADPCSVGVTELLGGKSTYLVTRNEAFCEKCCSRRKQRSYFCFFFSVMVQFLEFTVWGLARWR